MNEIQMYNHVVMCQVWLHWHLQILSRGFMG